MQANHAANGITTTLNGARFTMLYDAAGNMVRQSDASVNKSKQMEYDSANRINEARDDNTNIVISRYYYDDQGPLSDILSCAAFPTTCGSLPRAQGIAPGGRRRVAGSGGAQPVHVFLRGEDRHGLL